MHFKSTWKCSLPKLCSAREQSNCRLFCFGEKMSAHLQILNSHIRSPLSGELSVVREQEGRADFFSSLLHIAPSVRVDDKYRISLRRLGRFCSSPSSPGSCEFVAPPGRLGFRVFPCSGELHPEEIDTERRSKCFLSVSDLPRTQLP